ncbi:MAG: class I SAM-dependent methyltransferase [Hyphomicrobiales bacterium]
MAENGPDLDKAYSLKTPDDNIALYEDWADTYDQDFAQRMDYQLPRHVAYYFKHHRSTTGPILDVGAGTGLLADCLNNQQDLIIDAMDISAAMLDVASRKGLYRNMIIADLTKPLAIKSGSYDAIVSSGTFTHGHVGPDALDELLRICKKGALFVLSINAEHFVSHGFASKFEQLNNEIDEFALHTVSIYGSCEDNDHQSDEGHIAVFKKA